MQGISQTLCLFKSGKKKVYPKGALGIDMVPRSYLLCPLTIWKVKFFHGKLILEDKNSVIHISGFNRHCKKRVSLLSLSLDPKYLETSSIDWIFFWFLAYLFFQTSIKNRIRIASFQLFSSTFFLFWIIWLRKFVKKFLWPYSLSNVPVFPLLAWSWTE